MPSSACQDRSYRTCRRSSRWAVWNAQIPPTSRTTASSTSAMTRSQGIMPAPRRLADQRPSSSPSSPWSSQSWPTPCSLGIGPLGLAQLLAAAGRLAVVRRALDSNLDARSRDRLVHAQDVPGHHRPVIAPHRAGGRLHVAPAGGVVAEHLDERRGQRGGVVDGHQPARRTVLEHPPEGVQIARHHRRARRHGLHQHDAEALAAGVGGAVDVGAGHGRRLARVVDQTQESAGARPSRRPPPPTPPRRRVRRRGSRRRGTPRPGRAAHRAGRPSPCGVRRTGRGTAPSGPAAGSRRAGAPTRTTRRRPRWGSRRHRTPAPPSATAWQDRRPRCGRRSSRARAAGCPERR